MREQQIARKRNPVTAESAATGPRRGRVQPSCASAIQPGSVVWRISSTPGTFNNVELDDLIIARSDGTPTYNFCVVVDDMTWASRT